MDVFAKKESLLMNTFNDRLAEDSQKVKSWAVSLPIHTVYGSVSASIAGRYKAPLAGI
jgi:hypothetical protein